METYCWDSRKILIAEDEESNYLFIEALLEDTQAELLWAKNGIDVLDILNSTKDVDLILMDIRMPEMDGLEATKEIRKHNRQIPIIAQTAYAFSEDKNRFISAGCNEYLTKPLNHKTLLTIIEKYFND